MQSIPISSLTKLKLFLLIYLFHLADFSAGSQICISVAMHEHNMVLTKIIVQPTTSVNFFRCVK